MCGIAGILKNQAAVSENDLQAMKRSLKHRGPDDDGINVFHSSAGLAHTRLSIQDLSSRAKQPMVSPDGRYTIVFNGEIYNFKKLRTELEGNGESFVSDSDTEVILKIFSKKKEKCLEDLSGMFAFAVWDEIEQVCFLARDPLGIKPLYYLQQADQCAFASEFQVLRNHGLSGWQTDKHALEVFLRKGSMPSSETVDERIKSLLPGHFLFWKKGKWEAPTCYWQIDFSKKSSIQDERTATSQTRQWLLDSVKKHFVSDVDVGIFLSGGLDSTALLALSRHLGFSRLKTYTVGFKNFPDECDLARRTAKHFDAQHHEIILDADQADKLMDEYFDATDLPTIDGFNVMVVSKFAREKGAKVVLSGLGGDELFGGYKTFREVPRLYHWASQRVLKYLFGTGAQVMNLVCPSSKWKRLKELLKEKDISIEKTYLAYRGIFSASEARAVLNDLNFSGDSLGTDFPQKALAGWAPLDQIDWLEWTVYLRDQLLRDADVFSMRFGLELRVPFVDSILFDQVKQISASIRLNRKKLLQAAIPEIPDWVKNQPKRGFLFPFSSWNILDRHFKNAILKKRAVKVHDWYQKWALLQLDHCLARNG